jgi:hypothetical protein
MWTEITRRKYAREGQRYASDLTGAEWALIEPHMPALSVWAGRARPSRAVCSMRSCNLLPPGWVWLVGTPRQFVPQLL